MTDRTKLSVFSRALGAAATMIGALAIALPARADEPTALLAARPTEQVAFELYFPLRDRSSLDALIEAQNSEGSPEYHHWLTPAQFEADFGPTNATVSRVTSELAARGLAVVERSGQMLGVTGSASAVDATFGIRLAHARFADGTQRLVADRALTMPPALAASGALTPNFSTAAPKRKHSVIVGTVPHRSLGANPFNFASSVGPYLAADLRQAYDLPSAQALTAKGVRIAILMSGNYNASDMANYFTDDGLPKSLWPSITSIPINGGLAYSPNNSGETHLDIQQSGGVSLASTIGLYDLHDLQSSTILKGLNQIVKDNVADVVSMSFGGPEADYTAANNGGKSQIYLLTMEEQAFAQGTSQGMTFVASSGDHGAIPLVGAAQKPTLSVEDPASDPYVTGVGGTNLVTTATSASNNSAYVRENAGYDREAKGEVWASGGGVSIVWKKPSYQKLVPTQSSSARTVPDVAQHMGGCPGDAISCNSPDSADYEAIGGQFVGVIGTSASAPDIAGLLALKVALTKGRLGLENTDIYNRAKKQNAGSGKPFHHAGIPGNNGKYATKTPYDLVIGNGTVDGRQLLGTSLPAAGIPGTATNP